MNYQVIVLPLVTMAMVSVIKFFIKSNNQKFEFKNFFAYSGMPSGHSAMVASLTTIIGLQDGITSSSFAISVILAIIVIRDALGIRRYLGQHGEMLNTLTQDLHKEHIIKEKLPHLLEKVGHTPAQVIVGCIIGFVVSLVGHFLFV